MRVYPTFHLSLHLVYIIYSFERFIVIHTVRTFKNISLILIMVIACSFGSPFLMALVHLLLKSKQQAI